jgi:hypothetical protein
VPNGKRDSIAVAPEQIKTSGIRIFHLRISRVTQREISAQSTLIVGDDRSSAQKLLLHWGDLICFLGRADSFFKEKSEKYRSSSVRGWRCCKAFHAGAIAPFAGLAQAQFSHQRPHPFAFHQARR